LPTVIIAKFDCHHYHVVITFTIIVALSRYCHVIVPPLLYHPPSCPRAWSTSFSSARARVWMFILVIPLAYISMCCNLLVCMYVLRPACGLFDVGCCAARFDQDTIYLAQSICRLFDAIYLLSPRERCPYPQTHKAFFYHHAQDIPHLFFIISSFAKIRGEGVVGPNFGASFLQVAMRNLLFGKKQIGHDPLLKNSTKGRQKKRDKPRGLVTQGVTSPRDLPLQTGKPVIASCCRAQ
jgi:hypothetical protein